jgi:tetratricopeptide (TPR) repeat protein/transcriptional regulator with XRE-family HTH domain
VESLAGPSFGQALRDLRRRRGLSLTDLSRLVHYSKPYLSRVESGVRPTSPELARRCDHALAAAGALVSLLPEPAAPRRAAHQPAAHQPAAHQPTAHQPAALPPAIQGFTGRGAALNQLDAAQRTNAVSVIVGPPGVGKTALALHWAHRSSCHYPDGSLFADLRGYDPSGLPAEPGEVLDGFLRALGALPGAIPADVELRSGLLRTLLHGKRMLILLDNAMAPDQVRPLLPGSPSCRVLITSRSRLSGLVARETAARILLEPMPQDEALALLGRATGAERLATERDAAAEIAEKCGYLPLALRIAADRAGSRPRLTLAALASQLAAERDRLDLLATGDDQATAVRSAFSWSYRALPQGAARMFRLLGLHYGHDVGIYAAAALAGITTPQARRLLETLTAVHLLEESGLYRYRFHDLIRLYSRERAQAEESTQSSAAAVRRLLTWYLRTMQAADRLLCPHRPQIELESPRDASRPLDFADYDQALEWCDVERANLAAATRQAADVGEDTIAWQLPNAAWSCYNLRKPWADWISTYEIGLACARRTVHRQGEAWMLNGLGGAYFDLGRFAESLDYCEQALAIRRQIGDRRGECACMNNLGNICSQLGRLDDALAWHQQALLVSLDIDNPHEAATALNNMGETCQEQGKLEEALRCFRDALAACRKMGDRYGTAYVLDNLGAVSQSLKLFDQAIGQMTEALGIRREIGDRHGEAITLHHLGDLYGEVDRPDDARQAWRAALAIYEDLGDPRAAQLHATLIPEA